MNGVFDLGGTDGLGPVDPPESEPIFRAEWEKPMFTMFSACFRAGYFGLDSFRHGIEKIDPATYLQSPYYEHWLHTIEDHAVAAGAIDPDELDRRTRYYLDNPDAPLPDHEQNQELIDFVDAVVPAGAPAQRATDKQPRFSVGDVVRVRDDSPHGHTRRARYIRGRTGTVSAHRGSFIYPDAAGNGLGENPEHVYTVKFTSDELWGPEYADPKGSVYFDVWDPYIELVSATEGANA
ncbi:nitrile hydratase subunit beta [Williamsia sterculiae]|uniref:Nitrile hydratase subunit beta n=1 Tax=Williamsia sterculiae TaxID=1344003 RepID=A0A1N7H1W8_9NOCA|nr:nitrile hydratase subunit beta [Williamsia sterculiae]SIS18847.1 nitrile hydratase [Williamsia sterculiae]